MNCMQILILLLIGTNISVIGLVKYSVTMHTHFTHTYIYIYMYIIYYCVI